MTVHPRDETFGVILGVLIRFRWLKGKEGVQGTNPKNDNLTKKVVGALMLMISKYD